MPRKIENKYIEKIDHYELVITSRKHGVFNIKIDKDNYDKVVKYHWNINRYGSKRNTRPYYYVVNKEIGLLHRFLMDAAKGTQVDHIDGDTLNNTISNLRVCDVSKNSMNRHFVSRNTSGKVGVHELPSGRYMSYICIKQKKITLGYFDNIKDAIECRRNAEIEYFGEYKSSNKA